MRKIALVGEAHVVVRAITNRLDRDIRNGFRGITRPGVQAGESLGEAFSRGFNSQIGANVFTRLSDAIRTAVPGATAARKAWASLNRQGIVMGTTFNGLIQVISSLVMGIVALAGAAGGAAGAGLAVLGNSIFALIAAGISGKLALGGVGVALRELTNVNPFPKYTEAQKEFAEYLYSDVMPLLQTLKKTASQALLPPLEDALDKLTTSLFPSFNAGIKAVSESLGAAAVELANILSEPQNIENFSKLMQSSAKLIGSAGSILGSLIGAFGSIFTAAIPTAERFFNYLDKSFAAWDDRLKTIEGQAGLTTFFENAGDTAAKFGEIFGNIFDGFGAIISANIGPGSGGRMMLDWLAEVTAGFAALKDDPNIEQFFKDIATTSISVFGSLGRLLQAVFSQADNPALGEAFDIMGRAAPSIERIVKALTDVAPAAASAFEKLAEIVALLVDSPTIQAFFDTINVALTWVRDFVAGELFQSIQSIIGPILGVTLALGGIGNVLMQGGKIVAGYALLWANTGARIISSVESSTVAINKALGPIRTFGVRLLGAAASATKFTVNMIATQTAALGSKLLVALKLAGSAFTKLGARMLAVFTGPVGIVLLVIAALVGAMVALYHTNDEVRKAFDDAGKQIMASFGAAMQQLAPMIAELASTFASLVAVIAPLISQLVSSLVPVITSLVNSLLPIIVTVISILASVVVSLVDAFMPLLEAILPVISTLLSAIVPVIMIVIGAITPLINLLVDILVPVIGFLANVISFVITVLAQLIALILDGVIVTFQGLVDTITFFSENWSTIWAGISQFFIDIWNGIVSFITSVWNGIAGFFSSVIGGIVGFVQTSFFNIFNFIHDTFTKVKKTFETIWNGILNFMKGIINGIIGGVEGMVNSVIDAINGLLSVVGSVAGMLGDALGLDITIGKIPKVRLPRLAEGGVVPATSGGMIVQVAEAGRAERIEPLDSDGLSRRDKAWVREIIAALSTPNGAALAGGASWNVDFNVYDTSGDPARTAQETVNRLAERAGM